ncbi:invasion associated locus B family protein [Maribius pontilimi]|uniref:Invasion associated locus B family protein n=2 Tax=Palleronia pontilimi TaxID=1964209 RepID=A0A934MCN8_9RHOB|nr:invasion associated locus B family protein [Palleronia pontilimi]
MALSGASVALAQDDAAATDTADEPAAAAEPAAEGADAAPAEPDLNMGESVEDANAVGRSFVAANFGDWEQRCVRTADGADPCQLYQLLKDSNGNAVAEMSIFALPPGQQAAAGSTIITPLETLLTRQVTIGVDGGQAKRYPFDFCAEAGCFARVGFTAAEVSAFKRGNEAQLTIVPAAAPDQTINLTISLSGFTAGYDAVSAANADNPTRAQE